MDLYYSDHFQLPLPENHRFPMQKYGLLRKRIAGSRLAKHCRLLIPPAATDQQLSLVHSREYLQRIQSGALSDLEIRRIGFPWSKKMVERSRRSTGATIVAGRMAVQSGIAGNLAGGTHHAFADRGQGFCVFNDVCVAVRTLQYEGLAQTALIVDCDVHQGNGTASIAKNDPSIFSFSIHCKKNYPFQKTESDLDIALPQRAEDAQYLDQLQSALDQIFSVFDADIVFYLAGADPFVGDRLGLLSLTKRGLRQRDEIVFSQCRKRSIPVAFCMAGGYAPDVNDIVDIHFATVEVAYQQFAA